MLKDGLFRAFDDAWLIHSDAHVLVVDKPAGMASQAADAERPDDVASRLSAWLAARGEPSHVGVHQRLDRETSGVMVFSRSKAASATLAAQFESRKVEKRYVACVSGWPAGRADATLVDMLADGERGRVVVADRRDKRAKQARTVVRLLQHRSGRAKLELLLETGRTHQARVQLAHARAPIAGDTLYGAQAAPRLLLHAKSVSFVHPSGRDVTYHARLPAEFDAWLERGDPGEGIYDDPDMLGRALHRAAERRYGLATSPSAARNTTAFRLVNEAGDALPGLAVDVYGDWLVAQFYGDRPWRERALDALSNAGARGVYMKVRPKQANTLVDTRKDDLAPREPVRGEAAPADLPIFEEAVPYLARLGDGLSTGIFLDQRANRRRVREAAKGKRVLNLFSYTCGFSVAAAVGGARATVSVDASVAALERGREGFAHAAIALGAAHTFVADDAFSWLERAAKKGDRYDLIIVDPPSYSSTKARRFVAESDYAELAALALRVLSPGGELLACTNHRGIAAAKFRRVLFDALRLAGREHVQVKDVSPPLDYPAAMGLESHLKSVWVTLAR